MEVQQIEAFAIGLIVGLVITVIVYFRESLKRSTLRKEIKSLKNHLHQKMDIDAEATNKKREEIELLKKENENLRISNQSLAQKPGRREVINLHIYQRAVDIMSEAAVGFAPMWQKSLKEAQKEYDKAEDGKLPFIKKIIPLKFLGGDSSVDTKDSDFMNPDVDKE
ncbi:LapA family protein [Rapidithrix thailandica]|uniref:LapA family protein n=1 Tax=Rapidithrix thailandica TaxID=413964 RepID=A0AAW9RUJ4_9BACT